MLTNEDIDTLLEALDTLRSKYSDHAFTSVLLGAMLSEDKDKWKDEANKTMEEAREKGRSLEETIILLKAKLIRMRDQTLIGEMSTLLKKG